MGEIRRGVDQNYAQIIRVPDMDTDTPEVPADDRDNSAGLHDTPPLGTSTSPEHITKVHGSPTPDVVKPWEQPRTPGIIKGWIDKHLRSK